MAIRNFAPVYCNTCVHYDLDTAAQAAAPVWCPQRELMRAWDDRACVLFTPVNDRQRAARRDIVVQLHEDKKRKNGE